VPRLLRMATQAGPKSRRAAVSCRTLACYPSDGPAAPTPIQHISGLPQGLAGRPAAGWRRRGDGAGNKWRYERICSPDGIVLSGGFPWLSQAT
jgi:hypothetical protein